jgi:hypothetical protein
MVYSEPVLTKIGEIDGATVGDKVSPLSAGL